MCAVKNGERTENAPPRAGVPDETDSKNGNGADTEEIITKSPHGTFWQEDHLRILLDPTIIKSEDINKIDLSVIINEFVEKMLEREFIDFRIAGVALYNSAKLHHKKIRDVIDEEEKVHIKELRERTKREIPKAMPQPLRQPVKISTKEELVAAARAAIMEIMKKREILRRRREEREKRKEQRKSVRKGGELPEELIKTLTGQKKTVEQIINEWFSVIKDMIKSKSSGYTSFNELVDKVISLKSNDVSVRRYLCIELFMSLLYLSTSGKIRVDQPEPFGDLLISLV